MDYCFYLWNTAAELGVFLPNPVDDYCVDAFRAEVKNRVSNMQSQIVEQIVARHCNIIKTIYHESEDFLKPFLTHPFKMRYTVANGGDIIKDRRVFVELIVYESKTTSPPIAALPYLPSGSL